MGKEAKIIRKKPLRDILDEIDEGIGKKAFDGLYDSRLAIEMGMWNKGEAVGVNRGVITLKSYYQLEKETGRCHKNLKRWHELYLEYPDKGDYYLLAVEKAKSWAQKILVGSLVSKMTGNVENYTPAHIIENVRDVLGEIDLDPASCEMAQKVVKAKKYYTEETNGLDKHWSGKVFLNPPYDRRITKFTDKLIESLPDIEAAILLTNDQTDTDWWQKCAANANVVFMPDGRLSFYTPDKEKTSPTNGQTFFYYGDNEEKFKRNFQWGLLMKVV